MAARTVLSWSGGKDCALALSRLREAADVEIVALLTTVTDGYDRISIHGVRRSLLHAQAAALELPVHEVTIPPACPNDVYESATAAALRSLRAEGVHHIAFGDIFLADVRAYRERLAAAAGFTALFPLWGCATDELAAEVLERGLDARLVCVDTQSLPASFAGARYDRALLRSLPPGVDPCGERGEFHTFVSSGDVFRHAVSYTVGAVVLRDDRFAFCDLLLSGPAAES